MATAPQPKLPFIHPDDMPSRYALHGRGPCMEPIIADGAVVAFDKSETPEPGDIVSLIFTRSAAQRGGVPGMIKRLVSMPPEGFDGMIVVEMVNPHQVLVFPTTDVLGVHKCIGLPEMHADGTAWLRPTTTEA